VQQLNNQILLNTTLAGAGLQASEAGGVLTLASSTGSTFRISVDDLAAGVALGFNDSDAGTVIAGTYSEGAGFVEATVNAGGAQATSSVAVADPTSFSGLYFGNDVQSLLVSAKAPNGTVVSQTITLSYSNAFTLDQAIDAINTQLQTSNNESLQKIVAVKERGTAANTEGVRFLSTLQGGFTVAVGDLSNNHGIDNDSASDLLLSSKELAGGAIADISSKENAERAVTLLAASVSELARVQADVGKGQNQLQFAIGLATTQITNLAAAESRIRDADLAEEAANLTRASIAQQAGVAALAQANAAPQRSASTRGFRLSRIRKACPDGRECCCPERLLQLPDRRARPGRCG
jgi:flagellin